jgi:hypothetical protein
MRKFPQNGAVGFKARCNLQRCRLIRSLDMRIRELSSVSLHRLNQVNLRCSTAAKGVQAIVVYFGTRINFLTFSLVGGTFVVTERPDEIGRPDVGCPCQVAQHPNFIEKKTEKHGYATQTNVRSQSETTRHRHTTQHESMNNTRRGGNKNIMQTKTHALATALPS